MISNALKKIFGSRNDRLLKQYQRVVLRINALEPDLAKASDAEIRAKTDELKERLAAKVAAVPEEGKAEAERAALDELLPEAFAVVREAG